MKKISMLIIVIVSFLWGNNGYSASIYEAFSKGTLNGQIRTYYFERKFNGDSTDRADFAIGTIIGYKTSTYYGLSAGLTFASSNNIIGDNDKEVYGLLRGVGTKNHENYNRLQEYYIEGNWLNTKLKYGAQHLNTPFMNGHDIRMVPKTYKGLSVINNSIPGLTLSGYYITGAMGWWDENFRTLYDYINAEKDSNEGMYIGSIKKIFARDNLF